MGQAIGIEFALYKSKFFTLKCKVGNTLKYVTSNSVVRYSIYTYIFFKWIWTHFRLTSYWLMISSYLPTSRLIRLAVSVCAHSVSSNGLTWHFSNQNQTVQYETARGAASQDGRESVREGEEGASLKRLGCFCGRNGALAKWWTPLSYVSVWRWILNVCVWM